MFSDAAICFLYWLHLEGLFLVDMAVYRDTIVKIFDRNVKLVGPLLLISDEGSQ